MKIKLFILAIIISMSCNKTSPIVKMDWFDYIIIIISALLGGIFGPKLAKWVYKKLKWPWNN